MTDKQQQEPPKIEFPCPNYPIKAVGVNSDDFCSHVIEIVKIHVPDFDLTTVSIQDSRKGSFQSVRFKITAQGVDHLKALHEALIASDRVKMVI
ncbi:DUF493 domain-containing protein [uncultured Neptuniibacter sp.]|jgi:putative lipoic acid-binding regulatory protein|uniref:YbeD family protein n=1 Tax=uncultured Neptuniibacter sp. TaxID=502143 RepID=UPI0026036ED0|nr:DUF493 domain-containing protein [uncultured Neptuniibacter sp.]